MKRKVALKKIAKRVNGLQAVLVPPKKLCSLVEGGRRKGRLKKKGREKEGLTQGGKEKKARSRH